MHDNRKNKVRQDASLSLEAFAFHLKPRFLATSLLYDALASLSLFLSSQMGKPLLHIASSSASKTQLTERCHYTSPFIRSNSLLLLLLLTLQSPIKLNWTILYMFPFTPGAWRRHFSSSKAGQRHKLSSPGELKRQNKHHFLVPPHAEKAKKVLRRKWIPSRD